MRFTPAKTFAGLLFMLAMIVTAENVYVIDQSHASFEFSVKHLVISNVKGRFNKFEGTLVLDDKNKLLKAEATIDVESIDTGIDKRDEHLRSADFFEVAKYPVITFKSTKVQQTNRKGTLIGQFTIHGVTRELALPFELSGPITDPWGNKKIGFKTNTRINRTDYGLTWNKALESGGFVVGEEVDIHVDFEAAAK